MFVGFSSFCVLQCFRFLLVILLFVIVRVYSFLSASDLAGRERNPDLSLCFRFLFVMCTPSSHSKNSLSKIYSKGWAALRGTTHTICAKNFQGLGPKRPESWMTSWVYRIVIVFVGCFLSAVKLAGRERSPDFCL